MTIVEGPPGTRKTKVLCKAAKYTNKMKVNDSDYKILIVSQQNAACEHVAKIMKQDQYFNGTYDVMRKRSEFNKRIDSKYCIDKAIKEILLS